MRRYESTAALDDGRRPHRFRIELRCDAGDMRRPCELKKPAARGDIYILNSCATSLSRQRAAEGGADDEMILLSSRHYLSA